VKPAVVVGAPLPTGREDWAGGAPGPVGEVPLVLLPGTTGPGPREAVGAGANEVTAELAGLPGRVEVALSTAELLLTAAVVVAAAEEETAEEEADDAAELLTAAEDVAVGTVMVTPTDLQRASDAERALVWSEALQELWTQEVELLMKVLLEHAHAKSVTLQLVWEIPVVRQVNWKRVGLVFFRSYYIGNMKTYSTRGEVSKTLCGNNGSKAGNDNNSGLHFIQVV